MPTVVTIHDMLYWSHPELMSTPLYTGPVKWMEKRGAANATRVITDSQVSADEIVKYLGFPTDRLHVVPLAATHAVDRTPRPCAPENLVLASGQRRPHKNWDGLIRAPRAGSAGHPTAGWSSPAPVARTRFGRWSTGSASPNGSTLMGWVDDAELADLQARARVMAMPTLAEGFGLPVLEAMASGLPVMASELPVLREVGGDAVLYFDPRSTRAIADALRVVATEPERMEQLSAAGLVQAAAFSWRRVAEETLGVFRLVLSERTIEGRNAWSSNPPIPERARTASGSSDKACRREVNLQPGRPGCTAPAALRQLCGNGVVVATLVWKSVPCSRLVEERLAVWRR